MRFSKCPLCKNDLIESFKYLDKDFKNNIFQDLSIECCLNCGISWTNKKLNPIKLNNFYKKDYRAKDSREFFDYKNNSIIKNQVEPRSYAQILLGMQYLDIREKYNFLDIGPGPGHSFACFKKLFKNSTLYALDNNLDASKYYKRSSLGINVINNLDQIKEKIDFVLMSHSLEHFGIEDAKNLLDSLKKILSKGAIVVIEIPHDDFRIIEHRKNRLNDSPHLTFFSVDSIKKLCEKSNFNICFCNTTSSLKVHGNFTQKDKISLKKRFFKFIKDVTYKINFPIIIKILKGIKYKFFPTKLFPSDDFNYGGLQRSCLRIVLKNGYQREI